MFVDRHSASRMLRELERASMKNVLLEGILQLEDGFPVLTRIERVEVIKRLGLDESRDSPVQLTE